MYETSCLAEELYVGYDKFLIGYLICLHGSEISTVWFSSQDSLLPILFMILSPFATTAFAARFLMYSYILKLPASWTL